MRIGLGRTEAYIWTTQALRRRDKEENILGHLARWWRESEVRSARALMDRHSVVIRNLRLWKSVNRHNGVEQGSGARWETSRGVAEPCRS